MKKVSLFIATLAISGAIFAQGTTAPVQKKEAKKEVKAEAKDAKKEVKKVPAAKKEATPAETK